MNGIEGVESPILTYQHPDYENQVDLVGTVHMAEPRYYQAIQEFVDGRVDEGATVHYELTKIPTAEQLAEVPRPVRRRAERVVAAMGELYGMLGEIDGLVPQAKGLAYRDEWKNHDSTLLEQAASMSRLTVDGLWVSVKLVKLATRLLGQGEMQGLMLQQLSDAASDRERKPGLAERLMTIGRKKHVEVARNTIAMTAFDTEIQADPTTDLLLLWGVKHLKGLGQEVRNRGFVQTDERYLTAIHGR